MIKLHLYSTSHCHLCEQAEELLKIISKLHCIDWLSIEIADDTQLLVNYEIKIPVLKRLDNNTELSWPFTAIDIQNLIAK